MSVSSAVAIVTEENPATFVPGTGIHGAKLAQTYFVCWFLACSDAQLFSVMLSRLILGATNACELLPAVLLTQIDNVLGLSEERESVCVFPSQNIFHTLECPKTTFITSDCS